MTGMEVDLLDFLDLVVLVVFRFVFFWLTFSLLLELRFFEAFFFRCGLRGLFVLLERERLPLLDRGLLERLDRDLRRLRDRDLRKLFDRDLLRLLERDLLAFLRKLLDRDRDLSELLRFLLRPLATTLELLPTVLLFSPTGSLSGTSFLVFSRLSLMT
jgi:hypothetical protein